MSRRRALGMPAVALRALVIAIALVTLWLDLQTQAGRNIPAIYIAAIVLAGWCGSRDVWVAAIAATLLTSAGGVLLPPGGDVATGLFNRGLDVALLWGTLALVLRGRSAAGELEGVVRALSDFKYALDQSSIVAITDRRGRITYANDKFCEISKYSRNELLGQDHRLINSGHHPKVFMQDLWRTIGRGQVWHGELKNRAKDGTSYWVDTTIIPFLDARGRPYQYLAIRSDITSRKEAEGRLREQEALTRLGQMAAVVAHEVKNPLAGVLGSLRIVRSHLPSTGSGADVLDLMTGRLQGLNAMVDDLLKFARPKPPAFANVSVHTLLHETRRLLRSDERRAGVTVDIHGGDDLIVRADAEQLQQAFLNLFMNAAHAMDDRGSIRVTIQTENHHCHIAVADEGSGVPAEIRGVLFEPFFTTKARGTGLGLAIVKRIVERHGGGVDLAASDARGTTVLVTLPLVPTL